MMRFLQAFLPAVLLLGQTTSAPGPFVSPPDLAFGVSSDMRVAQGLLPQAKSLPNVAPRPVGSGPGTILPEQTVGSRGTQAERLVRELMMIVAPHVNTEEIIIDHTCELSSTRSSCQLFAPVNNSCLADRCHNFAVNHTDSHPRDCSTLFAWHSCQQRPGRGDL